MPLEPVIVSDIEIVGWIVSSYLTLIAILAIFIHVCMHCKKNEPKIIIPAVLSWLGTFGFCLMVGFFRTNVLFHSFDFSDENNLLCVATFGLTWSFYAFMKISMYFLFISRLETVFRHKTTFRTIKCHSWIARVLIVVVGASLGAGNAWLLKRTPATTPHGIDLCTGLLVPETINTIGTICTIAFTFFDIIINVYLIGIFCWYFYKMIKKIKANTNDRTELTIKLKNAMLQAIVLVTAASTSSLFFLIIGNMVYWPIGWFIPLDSLINGITIYCLFDFAEKTYSILCCPIISCCSTCFGINATTDAAVMVTNSSQSINKYNDAYDETICQTASISEVISVKNYVDVSEITMTLQN
eukprot:199764_1